MRVAFFSITLFAITTLAAVSPGVQAGIGASQTTLISLSLEKETMESALNRISRIVGYEITVSPDWANKVISIVLQNCRFEESLAKVIVAAGNPSHALIFDEQKKRIEILILGPARLGAEGKRVVGPLDERGEDRVKEAEPEEETDDGQRQASAADEESGTDSPDRKKSRVSFRRLKIPEAERAKMPPPDNEIINPEEDLKAPQTLEGSEEPDNSDARD